MVDYLFICASVYMSGLLYVSQQICNADYITEANLCLHVRVGGLKYRVYMYLFGCAMPVSVRAHARCAVYVVSCSNHYRR